MNRNIAPALLLLCAGLASVPPLPAQFAPVIRPRESRSTRPSGGVQTYQPTPEADAPARPAQIAVVGAVQSPGVFQTSRDVRFAELIAAAGGPTPDASPTVQIVRQGRVFHAGLYDPGQPGQDAMGTLLTGDVIVLRPMLGVRNAHYQTADASDGSPHAEQADQDRLVHVACVGLTDQVVVLPLDPRDASRAVLLHQLLGIAPGPEADQGVLVLNPVGGVSSEDPLMDGAVLLFDPQILGRRPMRPIEEFPQPRLLPPARVEMDSIPLPTAAPQEDAQAAAAADAPRLDRMPGLPFLVREADAPPAEIQTAELPAVQTPPMPPELGPPATDVTAAATDSAVDVTPVANALPAPPTETPATGPQHVAASFQRVVRDSTPKRLNPVASAPSRPAPVSQEPPRTSEAASAPETSRARPVLIALGAALFALGLVGCSWLASRSERKRRRRQLRIQQALGINDPAPVLAVPRNDLKDLLSQASSIQEQPNAPLATGRLYGRSVGHLRLLYDPPHAGPEAPHFLSRSRRPEHSRTWRALSQAAAFGPRSSHKADVEPQPESISYDRVEPELSVDAQADRAAQRPDRDLLERILESLREER